MKKTQVLKWKITLGLLFVALLIFVSSASASLVMTGAYQQSGSSFTPTWTVAPSLIAGMSPTAQAGNFTSEGNTPGVSALTDGVIGPCPGSYNIFAAGGPSAGQLLTYTLPVQTYGYDLTNITVYSGWGNGGRVGQGYTVLYSTIANPTYFIMLTNVSYSAGLTANNPNNPVSIQVQLSDSAGGIIASNVVAIQFNFNSPSAPADENGGTGYSEITVQGNPSATSNVVASAVVVTGSNESGSNPFTNTWTAETPNLIAGLSPTIADGDFTGGGYCSGPSVLTDGAIGVSGNASMFSACGYSAGTTLIYTLTNSLYGSDVTNIVTYSGWADAGRYGQYYTVSYSTVLAPSTFIPLTTVFYIPYVTNGTPACRVAVNTSTGAPLATNVYQIKFDFAGPPNAANFNNGWQGYSEIIVQGANSAVLNQPILAQNTLPSYAETVVGDQVVFSATYNNNVPDALQWLVIQSGVTNIIPGATNSTLTLNNLQLTNSGTYMLMATNTANGAAAPSYSTGAPLVISNSPAAVNNVIVNYAGQTFSGTNYFPGVWPVDTTDLNLILGFQYGSLGTPGTLNYASGVPFGIQNCDEDPSILSDGIAASMVLAPTASAPSTTFCGCGRSDYGAGTTLTYTLVTNSAPYGLNITNITVFGGWASADHNEQSYQVLYSTVQSPTNFVPLVSADYLPADPSDSPSVTRTTLVPANGVMVHNVAALEFNWNVSSLPKNGWGGYSEILVGGSPSTGFAPALTQDVTPNTASDVVGSQIILTAGFSGATTLQWQFNGTNVPGATSSTLTLNNLQLTNSGNYSLLATNANGTTSSSACVVTVNPVPAAVSNTVVSIALQTSQATQFTPTWSTNLLSSSLIYTVSPIASGIGSFTTPDGNGEHAATPVVLTDGSWGYFGPDNSTLTCMGYNLPGPANSPLGEGNFVTYSLGGAANGYTITNIVSSGGWVNNGRNAQAYTVYYSTVTSPTYFIPLAVVNYLPTNTTGISATRATITPASGVLASNVAAVMFNMTSPQGENGYEGYNELAVYGSPSASAPAPGPVVTAANEEVNVSLDWMAESPNLIGNQLPSSVGSGDFTQGGGSVTGLTDGILANMNGGNVTNFASCGSTGGQSVTYTCTNGTWNLTNIVVYSGWPNNGRDGQFYNLSYSTPSAPATFIPLTSIAYNPIVTNSTPSLNRVDITSSAAGNILATNVYAVQFDFTPQLNTPATDNGWSGYAEIILQGTNVPAAIVPTLPTMAPPRVSGGNLILTGTGGTPAGYSYTWLTTTNLKTPLANWTTNTTGNLSGTGSLSNAIPITATPPASFFRLRMP
jgi:hypothetical protein